MSRPPARSFLPVLLAASAAWPVVALLSGVANAGAGAAKPQSATTPCPASVAFTLDHNRVIVDVELKRTDGTLRTARAWLDTGNQFLVVGEALAQDLGLDVAAPAEAGAQYAQVWARRTPEIRLGGVRLDVEGVKTKILSGTRVLPGVPAEVNLPASVFRRQHLVLDYGAQRVALARPGSAKPRGVAIPCRVNAETGLFQIETMLGGEPVRLGVDSGSAYTWISEALTRGWQSRHADWPRSTGAVGAANFFGFDFEPRGVLMRVPELRFGTITVRHVGVLGLDQGLFDWYSTKSAGPVVGFIGANVLKGFRIEIDFPNQVTYWEAGSPPEADDLDTVGLTLRPEPDGRYTIAGVATKDEVPAVAGVEPGSTLVSIDGVDVAKATMGTVATALHGRPGAVRVLVVEHAGARLRIGAKVLRFP